MMFMNFLMIVLGTRFLILLNNTMCQLVIWDLKNENTHLK